MQRTESAMQRYTALDRGRTGAHEAADSCDDLK